MRSARRSSRRCSVRSLGSVRFLTEKSCSLGSELTTNGIPAAAEVGRVVEEVVGAAAEVRHGDIRRQPRLIGAAQPGHGRAERGPALHAVVRGVEGRAFEAREHPVVALGVVAGAVVDGPQHGQLVHQAGLLGHQLAELDAGHVGVDRAERAAILGRRLRLGVPGLHVPGAAAEPEQDDARPLLRPADRAFGPQLRSSASVSPPTPSAPACKKLRRDQIGPERSPLIRSIGFAGFLAGGRNNPAAGSPINISRWI